MENIKTLIGRRIRFLRKRLKLSQEELAYRASLDRTYVASIENGRRNVSIINIERLAVALNCSLYQFFNTKDFKRNFIYKKEIEETASVAENEEKKYQ